MDERLKAVTEAGDIDALYALIRECPKVLEDTDHIPFVDTPLHIAASAGHTHFAVEMISLMPSFGRKLNPDGLSPLHLALQNMRADPDGLSPLHLALQNRHRDTVMRLINIDSELIRVQGKKRITPLHYVAAEKNKVHLYLLAEFLCACPESVQDLTVGGETAVHIAVKNYNFDAFEVLFGWAEKTNNKMVLQWKDENGNAALHIAASTDQPQVVKKLIKHVKINDKNLVGETALDLSEGSREIRNMLMRARATRYTAWIPHSTRDQLVDFMRSKQIDKLLNLKNMSDDKRNTVLVVATLVATATYQVAVDPPDSLFKEKDGKKILDVSKFIYCLLLFINSTAFAASLGVILLSLQVSIHFVMLRLCLVSLIYSFIVSVSLATPIKTVASYLAISAPFVLLLCIACWRNYHFWSEAYTLKKLSIGRYNPSHFFEMKRQMVGWYTIS